MPRSEVTTKREQIRQNVRDGIEAEKLVGQVVENIDELNSLAREDGEVSAAKIGAFKAANEAAFKLLNKVLPDVKSVDHTSSDGSMSPSQLTDSQLDEQIRKLIDECKG